MTKSLHHKAMLPEEKLCPVCGVTRKKKRSRKDKDSLDQVEVKLTSLHPMWATYTN